VSEHRDDPVARTQRALREAEVSIKGILARLDERQTFNVTRLLTFVLGLLAAIIVGRFYGLDDAPLIVKIATCYLGGHIGMAPYR